MRRLTLPDTGAPAQGARISAPSAARNLDPIARVLARVLPDQGRALELASGTGQHVAAFGRRFPGLSWQPSDANPDNLRSIAAWCEGAVNIRPPVVLDACQPGWAAQWGGQDAICLTNLLHLISEPEARALLAEVARALAPDGVFCLYGPFRQAGALVSEGDAAFDAALKAQDPAIGYKAIEGVAGQLTASGLIVEPPTAMPANNLMLIARRA